MEPPRPNEIHIPAHQAITRQKTREETNERRNQETTNQQEITNQQQTFVASISEITIDSNDIIDFKSLRKRDGKPDSKWKIFESQAQSYFEKKKLATLNDKEKSFIHSQIMNLGRKTASAITGSEIIELKVKLF